jgi:hypothetical protein
LIERILFRLNFFFCESVPASFSLTDLEFLSPEACSLHTRIQTLTGVYDCVCSKWFAFPESLDHLPTTVEALRTQSGSLQSLGEVCFSVLQIRLLQNIEELCGLDNRQTDAQTVAGKLLS